MVRRILVTAVASGAVLGLAGCHHKCCRTDGCSPGILGPRPFLPSGPGTTIPPAGVPVTPGTTVPPITGSGGLPPPDLSPSVFPPGTSGRPAPEILTPDPLPGGPSSRGQRPFRSGGILGGPVNGPAGQTLEPPVAAKPGSTASAKPAGLPGLTKIRDGVATGRRPTLDGFDALKKAGYRTAVYLYPPGADVAAVRDLAETRGLAFAAVETTPEMLADAFGQVSKLAADKSARPLYVFDDDGLRTGAVWYLYFKTVELESPEVSKIRARAIGLADGSEFWPAIRRVVAR